MKGTELKGQGISFYIDQVKKGSTEPYFAYRLYEQSWLVPAADEELLRRATSRLIEADPWFLATAMPYFLHSLHTEDLKRLTPFVGAGQSRGAAAVLRAVLWHHGRAGRFPTDRAGRAQLRVCLSFLTQVPRKQRELAWHEMRVGCYRVLDYTRYKRTFPSLYALTSPEWRAAPLISFLNTVRSKKDWKTYDRVRREWARLPPSAHVCECDVNQLHTNDGLRAIAQGDWEAVAASLTKAAEVRGCPHLNSNGFRLDVVEALVAKKKLLAPARAYLERAAQSPDGKTKLKPLQQKLERLIPKA